MEFFTRSKNNSKKVDICTITRNELLNTAKSNRFSMHFISAGNINLIHNGNEYVLNAPCILCLDDETVIEYTKSDRAKIHTIIFNPTFININTTIERLRKSDFPDIADQHTLFRLEAFLSTDFNSRIIYTTKSHFRYLIQCFNHLSNELNVQSDLNWSCRVRSYFMDIISSIEKIYHNFYSANGDDEYNLLFTEITSYIEENLSNKIKIEDVCKRFNINKNKIQLIFKQNVSKTFYDYVIEQRLERAGYYLRFTNISISEIAFRIGYSGEQNFSRFFTDMMGITPTAFRKREVNQRKAYFAQKNYKSSGIIQDKV